MKTKEFIVKVEALGFLVHDGHCYLEVKDTEGKDVVDILKAKRWVYDCEFDAFESLHEGKQTELMGFVTEYVTTQVKDREEEKRYRLKLTLPAIEVEENMYLVLDEKTNEKQLKVGLMNMYDYMIQDIFTESEISQMDTTGFVKVEVPEC